MADTHPLKAGVLITGGAGFIGSHTVDHLLAQQIPVTIFDNLATGKLQNLNLDSPLLTFKSGDVCHYAEVAELVQKSAAVLHLAALPSVIKSIEDPLESHAVNMVGFLNVLEAIRAANKPIRFVYASSSAIYGDTQDLPCRDDKATDNDVLSPYALQKMQIEQYAQLYFKLFGIRSLGLRYFNVYGPRQDPQSLYSGVISRFMKAFAHQEKLTIYGDGLQSRDFIHVLDIAKANGLALSCDYHGALNIATGIPETINNLIAYIEANAATKALREYVQPRLGDIRESYAAVAAAQKALAFTPTLTLSQGIKAMLAQKEF
jgi:UDP-glucose 4-epimerase